VDSRGSDEEPGEDLSRRDLLRRGVTGAAAIAGSEILRDKDLPQPTPDIIRRLRYIEWENVVNAPSNMLDRVSGSSVTDLRYRPRFTAEKLQKMAIQGPENNNGFQSNNATVGSVATPEDGFRATLTEGGRLNNLFQRDGASSWIPYFTDGEGDLKGSIEEEGSYAEFEVDGSLKQPWDMNTTGYSTKGKGNGNTGIFEATYWDDEIEIIENTYIVPGKETLQRDYSVENTSDETLSITFNYHSRVNVNDNPQNFIFYDSSENKAFSREDGVLISDQESDEELSIALEGADSVKVDSLFEEGPIDAAKNTLKQTISQYLVQDTDSEDKSVDTGRYMDVDIEKELSLDPGESEDISVSISPNSETDSMGDAGEEAEDFWDDFLSELDIPSGMTEEEEDAYKDCARILAGLHNPEESSSPAAPSVEPLYHPAWIRDGAFQSVARAKSGLYDQAKSELANFMSEVQSEDGGFKQCFNPEGGMNGVWEVQNDQPSLFTWAVSEVYEETGDDDFLEDVWENVEQSQEYLMDDENRAGNGLMKAAPDYSEDLTDFTRQSLWTQMLAYESLTRAADLADELGKDSEKYRNEAENIGEEAYKTFFDEPDDPFSEIRAFIGENRNFGALESFMVWPGSFAQDYGIEDDVIQILDEEVTFPPGFIPGQMNYAGMLYNQGMEEQGDEKAGYALDKRYDAGGLPEQLQEDGEDTMAYPLGWSQAGFITAMEEKYSQA
jgi:GH15 family glucan-1,4-alpha-glucosidase